MKTSKSLIAVSLMLLFSAACGSSGAGDIFGGSQQSNYEIRGVVDYVDASTRSVYLTNVSGYTNMLSNSGDNVRVYFDDNTAVEYQGQRYRPEDLERGDEIAVRVDESGNRLHADSMTVLRDVSGSSGLPSGTIGSTVRGTVRYIDTSRGTIEIDRSGGSLMTLEYDTSTPVYFNSQTYRVSDLERGDEIEIRARDFGSGRLVAQDITVLRNVSGGTSGSSTALSTIRGTVRTVDTYNRVIELESPSWISGFNTGAGSGSRLTITYGSNAGVDVQGRLHPVEGLERGDVIDVQVRGGSGTSTYFAERIFLVRDVNAR